MPEPSRETHLLGAVVALVDSLLDDFDVIDLLTELTEHCAELLDIASAGLLLADPRHQLHLMAATSEATHDLELFQLQADEGPCLDCYTSGHPVSVADLSDARARWPRFVTASSERKFLGRTSRSDHVVVHCVPTRSPPLLAKIIVSRRRCCGFSDLLGVGGPR